MTSTTTAEPEFSDSLNPQETARQIGSMNLMAISGGRASVDHERRVLVLPVGSGYSVEVGLAWNDTYTVRRVFTRAGRRWVKGERTEVYCDELGNVAYYASCFRSYGETEWVAK